MERKRARQRQKRKHCACNHVRWAGTSSNLNTGFCRSSRSREGQTLAREEEEEEEKGEINLSSSLPPPSLIRALSIHLSYLHCVKRTCCRRHRVVIHSLVWETRTFFFLFLAMINGRLSIGRAHSSCQ